MRTPTDRLAKIARRTYVGIYSDTALGDAVDVAQLAYDRAESQANTARAQRILTLRADSPDLSTAEIEQVADAEREAALEPFQAELDAAYAALDAGTLWFTFRSIGRDNWYDLLAEHPPTEDDVEEWSRAGLPGSPAFSRSGIEAHLLAAAAVEPALTLADAKAILASPEWNEAELAALFNAALAAQTQVRTADDARRPR